MTNPTFEKYRQTNRVLRRAVYRALGLAVVSLMVVAYLRIGKSAEHGVAPAYLIGLLALLFIGRQYEKRILNRSMLEVRCPKCQISLFSVFDMGRRLNERHKLRLERKPVSIEYCPFCGCRLADCPAGASQKRCEQGGNSDSPYFSS